MQNTLRRIMIEVLISSGRNWKKMVIGMTDLKAEMITMVTGIGTGKSLKTTGKDDNPPLMTRIPKTGISIMIIVGSGSCRDTVVRGVIMNGLMVGLVIGKMETGVKL